MIANASSQLDCIDVEQQSTDDVLKVLVSTVKDQQETIEQQQETIEQQQNTIDGLKEQVEADNDQTDDIEENTARIDALSTGIENINDELARLDDEIDEIKPADPQGSPDDNHAVDSSITPETPLEQTTALPQEMIDEESPNVQRAIFVASDVSDYSRSVPAGQAIKSSELRKVLKAGTDASGHTQTVSRVMNILDQMGGDEVKIVDRRGEKRVVFTDEAVARLEQLAGATTGNHTVVIGDQVGT